MTLHGKIMGIQNPESLISLSIHMIVVQKSQVPRSLELAFFEADKLSALILVPIQVKLRAARGNGYKRADDRPTGHAVTNNDSRWVCLWTLMPSTPLQDVIGGTLTRDSKKGCS